MPQLIGYVSDEWHVAIEGAALEFIRGEGPERVSVEAHSRASGAIHADLEPGAWTVAVWQAGLRPQDSSSSRSRPGCAPTVPAAGRPAAGLCVAQVGPAGRPGGAAGPSRRAVLGHSLWRYGWEPEQVAGPRPLRVVRARRRPPGRARRGLHRRPASAGTTTAAASRPTSAAFITAPERTGLYYVHLEGERIGAFFSFPLIVAPGGAGRRPASRSSRRTSTGTPTTTSAGAATTSAPGGLAPEPVSQPPPGSAPYLRDTGAPLLGPAATTTRRSRFDRPEPVNRIERGRTITDVMARIGEEHVAPGDVAARRLAGARGLRVRPVGRDPAPRGHARRSTDYKVLVLDQHPEYWTRDMYWRASRRGSSSAAASWSTWAATASTARWSSSRTVRP